MPQGFRRRRLGFAGRGAGKVDNIQAAFRKFFRKRDCASNTVKSIYFTDIILLLVDINEEMRRFLLGLRDIAQQPESPDLTALLR